MALDHSNRPSLLSENLALNIKLLARALAGDSTHTLAQTFGYLYWNARGVRVTPDCRVDIQARLERGCAFFFHCLITDKAEVGSLTYATRAILHNVRVGRLCSLAPGCILGLNEHPLDKPSTHPRTYDAETFDGMQRPCVLEDDVWVGANAVILAGVNVGIGAVIAAGAVVTRDVDAFTVVGGVPAKPIAARKRDPVFVEQLAAARGWHELLDLASKTRKRVERA